MSSLTLTQITVALVVTTIHTDNTVEGTNNVNTLQTHGKRSESGKGATREAESDGHCILSSSTKFIFLNQLLSDLGQSPTLSQQAPLALLTLPFLLPDLDPLDSSINTAGPLAASQHMLLFSYLPNCLHSTLEDLWLL